jgi:hypothetical protein
MTITLGSSENRLFSYPKLNNCYLLSFGPLELKERGKVETTALLDMLYALGGESFLDPHQNGPGYLAQITPLSEGAGKCHTRGLCTEREASQSLPAMFHIDTGGLQNNTPVLAGMV